METGATSSGPADGVTSLMDHDETNPGPIDPSVLYDQENHVSSAIWDGQERGVLRCHEHTSKLGEWRLTQQQIELVEKAGFGFLRRLPSISLDNPLISALIERWRKETNTFHLRVGEMTITLEDVALLLGLAIDGEPVLGVTYTSCKAVCEKFLGKLPDAGYKSGGMVKLSWLKEYFSQCPGDASLEEIERHTRAYLLYLVGSTIFSTTTGNKVPIMYLPLFEDFEKAGKYAWGAAALAFLYRALGKATLKSQSTISGCLTLLQCWSYFHLNIGRPKFHQEPIRDCFPFVHWWKGKQSAATVKRDIIFYRKALNSVEPCDVEWFPYSNVDSTLIPEHIRSSLILGRSKTMLICFDKAERHLPDRCLKQHGMLQGIPEDVQHWERKSRGVDSGVHLSGKMESELNEWLGRQQHIVQDDGGVEESEYMEWYSRITCKFIGRPVTPLPQIQRIVKFRTKKKRMNTGLRDIAHIADTFLIQGLDPMQIESISRIRAIAHDCLGDHAGGATIGSATPHVGGATIASPAPHVGGATKASPEPFLECATLSLPASLVGAAIASPAPHAGAAVASPAPHVGATVASPVPHVGGTTMASPAPHVGGATAASPTPHVGGATMAFPAAHVESATTTSPAPHVGGSTTASPPSHVGGSATASAHPHVGGSTAASPALHVGGSTAALSAPHAEGATTVSVSATPQNEHGKRKKEKEHVRRNSKGKRKRKDDPGPYYMAREFDPVQFYAAAFRADPMQFCWHCRALSAISHMEHSNHKLGKRLRRKEKARKRSSKKGSRKRKRKDDRTQCEAPGEDVQSQFTAAAEDYQAQLDPPNCKDNQLQQDHAASEGVGSRPCYTAVEGEQSEAYHASGVGEEAGSSLEANKVDGSKHSDVAHEINDLNLSPVVGDTLPQTAKVVGEGVPESSIETGKDVAQQIDDSVAELTEGNPEPTAQKGT